MASVGFAVGCANGPDPARPATGDGVPSPGAVGGVATGACEGWATRPCGIELGTKDGYVSCARGSQVCDAGRWGACQADGALGIQRFPAPPVTQLAPGPHLGALAVGGSASACLNNPCDPTCQVFDDVPDAPIQSPILEAGPPIVVGGNLAASNLPTGFKSKGSDEKKVCTPGCTSAACQQACQYDQRCSSTTAGECEPYPIGTSGQCTGIDLSVGVGCVTQDEKFRLVFVCNRGTLPAPPGAACWLFPGNSQQMPSATPDLTGATRISTTATTLQPGECEEMQVSNTHPPFDSNGAQEMVCNVAGGFETVTVSVTDHLPSANANVTGQMSWKAKTGAYAVGSPYAFAAPAIPAAGSAGPAFGTTNGTVGTDTAWDTPTRGYAEDLIYATTDPGMPALTTGTSTRYPSSDTKSLGSAGYTNDGSFATLAVPSKDGFDVATIDFSGFTFDETNVPLTATVTTVDLHVVWKTDDASHKVTSAMTARAGAAAVSSTSTVSFSGTAPTNSYTQSLANIATITAANLRDPTFGVRMVFTNGNSGANKPLDAMIDYVEVVAHWSNGVTTSSVSYGDFGFDGYVPSAATVTSLTIEGRWHTSLSTPDAELVLGAYTGGQLITGGSYAETQPPTTPTVRSITINNPGLTGGSLADGVFDVRVRANRELNGGASAAFTAFLDYIKVSATWTAAVGSATNAVSYSAFGFAIPAAATITKITTEASWKVSTAAYDATFGLAAYNGASALGTEVTDATKPLGFVTATQVVDNPAVTPADLNGGNFAVQVRVTR